MMIVYEHGQENNYRPELQQMEGRPHGFCRNENNIDSFLHWHGVTWYMNLTSGFQQTPATETIDDFPLRRKTSVQKMGTPRILP
jgi:hypothetical protein